MTTLENFPWERISNPDILPRILEWATNPKISWVLHQRYKNKLPVSDEITTDEIINTLRSILKKIRRIYIVLYYQDIWSRFY